MTLSKVKLGDCPPPPLHPPPPPPPPPPHPHHTMATHQPLYQHRLRLQQQTTEDDEGVEMMACTGRSYKAGGGAAAAAAASIILHHRPPWHIKDEVLPQIHHSYDEFEEWPNGYVQRAYSSSCPDAKGHQSGWAMRNTNNHDPKRLKKSCLGVMMCSQKCINDDGFMVHIRPYICDKARRKQEGIRCPTKGCDGHLFQVKCSGHAGKPVTHIWRTECNTIFFQAKGEHGHLAPEPKMSVNARRLVESRNRPLHSGTIRRISKTRGNRKTNRINHSASQMTISWCPRDVMPCDVFSSMPPPSHPFDYPHPDMAILALQQQQQQHQPHHHQTTTGSIRSTIVGPLSASSSGQHHLLPSTSVATAQFIALDDLPPPPLPPLPPPSSNWPSEMAPPDSSCPSSIDGAAAAATCRSFFDDVCVSMAFSPGPGGGGGGGGLLQDAPLPPPPSLKDYAMVHHGIQQSHVPFCLPSSQSTYPSCGDQGFILSDGSFRCTSGSADSEDDIIGGGGRFDGSPAAGMQGLIGTATGIDGYLLSELGQTRQYQTRWLSDMSPLDHSPNHSPSVLCQYPPFQYRSQLDHLQESHQRTTKANISFQRAFLHQQHQHQSSHLSPSFDHQMQHPSSRAIAGIVGLGTPAAATAVYFGSNDYLPNSVRL